MIWIHFLLYVASDGILCADRLLLNGPAMAGVLTVLHACIDMKGTLLDKFHYLLYFLAPSMNPRFLVTLDENLEMQPTTVRVGLAVETVGQAGRPRTITGFQVGSCSVMCVLLFSELFDDLVIFSDEHHPSSA